MATWKNGMSRGDRRELAATVCGMEYREMAEYRYQPSTFRPPLYAIGDRYIFVGTDAEKAKIEKKLGLPMTVERDAFLQSRAQESGWTIWTATAEVGQ